jgi:hypothetical protein
LAGPTRGGGREGGGGAGGAAATGASACGSRAIRSLPGGGLVMSRERSRMLLALARLGYVSGSYDLPVERDPSELVDLTSVTSEFEGATIVEALRAQGIPANHYGGGLAGFRADVPGFVRVVVRRQDLGKAQLALRAIHADSIDIDWDEVDVGQPEEPVRESLPDGSGYKCSRCGYRLDHVPAEKPCPECGATAMSDEPPPSDLPVDRAAARVRRARRRTMMLQIALALAAAYGTWVMGLDLRVWMALAVTILVMIAWIIWDFVRPRQAPD